ncbi:MAG TPA: hypothetical protein VGJ92_04350 [Methanocella sp.]
MSSLPLSPLSEIFGGSSSADLIVFLVYNHDRDFSVQDIADRMKVSKARVSKMKEGLLKYGVVKENRKVGKIAYYRYDRSSRYGKLLYDLVFTAHASPDRTQPVTPVAATPAPKNKDKDEGGKIIIA